MTIPVYKTVGTDDLVLQKIQDNSAAVFEFLGKKPIIDGSLLEDIAITTSFQNIAHKLGRAVKGYILVKTSVQLTVWDNESANTRKTLFLSLRGSVAGTISLWVF